MHTWVLGRISPNDHSHLPLRAPGQRIAAAFVALEVLTRRLGSLNYAFVNRETETAAKVVSIGTRWKRP